MTQNIVGDWASGDWRSHLEDELRMDKQVIRYLARYIIGGLIETALSSERGMDSLVDVYGLSESDAKALEEELKRLAEKLKKS
jgi:hypothetical protein